MILGVDFATSIAGYITSIGIFFTGTAAIAALIQARKNGRQLTPRNGKTVAQTAETTADDVRDLRHEVASVANALGEHLGQSDIDRKALKLPPIRQTNQENPE